MAGRANPRRSGALEREIVACLAAAGELLTPAQVQERLGADLAYTTVLTTLTRLFAKHAVTREQRGRAYAYALIGTRAESEAGLTARQMRKLLDAGTDRASVLSRFVETLDADSEALLRELLSRPQERTEPAGMQPAGSVQPAGNTEPSAVPDLAQIKNPWHS